MKIIHKPVDGERKEYTFRPGELSNFEAEAIEDRTDWNWEEFAAKFMNGNMRAYRAALWTCLRRENPRIKYDDVSFRVDEIDVDLEEDEKNRLWARVENDQSLDDDEREAMLSILGEGLNREDVDNPEIVETAVEKLDQIVSEEAVTEPVGKDTPVDSGIAST